MAATLPEKIIHVSASRKDGNEIPMTIPIFSWSRMTPKGILCKVIGNPKYKMAAMDL